MVHPIAQLFTGKDNATLDLGRVLWASAHFVFYYLSALAAWRGHPWSPVDWATAEGLLLGAGGLSLAAKATTEPPPCSPSSSPR